MKKRIAFLVLLLTLSACVTRFKWNIKWDKEKDLGRTQYFEQNIARENAGKPNVIILLCDDLGKYELSAYGAEQIETPHMDQLGAEGVIFEEGYVTSPTCATSRAGLLTGRIQNRYGFETQIMDTYPTNMVEYLSGKYFVPTGDWVMVTKPQYPSEWQVHKQGVPPTEINLAELLQHNGYRTGITGKWHLGSSKHHIPNNRGFDYQYGFYGAFSLYSKSKSENKIINYVHESFSTKYQWDNGRDNHGAIRENDKELIEEDYLTFAIRDRAIDFIKSSVADQEPFFLYCAFSAPHIPFQAHVDYYCRYEHIEDENKRVYYAMISALDDAVGEIHQAVKDAGEEENTIIFLLSDNGGATYTGATTNGPLKGGKLTQFEGGINVPFMMKWKGKVPKGLRYKEPVMSTDIFVTAAAQGAIKLPSDRRYDGVDLVPYLNGLMDQRPHERLFWRCDHIWAIREGDYKMILSARDGWAELYNLKLDKYEKFNLKEDMPDLFKTLRDKHLRWQKELPDKPLWPRIMDHKFVFDDIEYLFPA